MSEWIKVRVENGIAVEINGHGKKYAVVDRDEDGNPDGAWVKRYSAPAGWTEHGRGCTFEDAVRWVSKEG